MQYSKYKKEYPILFLLLTNFFLIILAASGSMTRGVFAFSLLYQMIIIGIVSLFDILTEKRTGIYGHPAAKTLWAILLLIGYFAIISWTKYTIIEGGLDAELKSNASTIVTITSIGFLIAYILEYVNSRKNENQKELRIKKFWPFLRILPIALIIPILSASGKSALIILIILTTIAEIALHLAYKKF